MKIKKRKTFLNCVKKRVYFTYIGESQPPLEAFIKLD